MRALLIGAAVLVPFIALAHGDKPKLEAAAFTPTQVIGKLSAKSSMRVEIGGFARINSSNPRIQKLGEKLVKDHGSLDQALLDYAKAEGISVVDAVRAYEDLMDKSYAGMHPGGAESEAAAQPRTWKDEKREKVDRLRARTGADFDREFLADVAEGSGRMISFLQEFKGQQTDRKLTALLNRFISAYQGHQRDAQKLQSEVPAT